MAEKTTDAYEERDSELDEVLAEVLIAISVISKKLAKKIRQRKQKKMSDLTLLLDDLISCGNKLTETTQALNHSSQTRNIISFIITQIKRADPPTL